MTLTAQLRAAGFTGRAVRAALALHKEQDRLNTAPSGPGKLIFHLGSAGIAVEADFSSQTLKNDELDLYGECLIE